MTFKTVSQVDGYTSQKRVPQPSEQIELIPLIRREFILSIRIEIRVDTASVRDAWLVHKDLDVIAKSGALGDEARVVDLKDHERAIVWIDDRIEAVLKPAKTPRQFRPPPFSSPNRNQASGRVSRVSGIRTAVQ